jgi:hypothetical protein
VRRANIAATIKEGETLKLLVAQRQGKDLSNGRRQPTLYRLTYLATHDGNKWALPTDDWKRYRPPENSETRFRRRNSVGSASGTRARAYFEENRQSPSSASGT